ncbi:hypothetical protein Tco_0575649, partial [Tanacetum coccineum]
METQKSLLKDEDGEEVDVHMCRLMIVSLMYLTSSRPDIIYLKGQPKLGLWYPKDSPFDLVAYTDSDYAGASLDRKSTTGELGEGLAILTDPHHTPTIIQPSTQPQKTQKPRKPKRKDTHVPQPSDPSENVTDEDVHKELGDSLVRAATTASSLEAEQDSGNTLRSDEDRLKLDELMALCTTLQTRVLDLEKTKTTQGNEIASLKRRVNKLEKKNRSRSYKLKRLYKVGLTARVESSGDEESLGGDAS